MIEPAHSLLATGFAGATVVLVVDRVGRNRAQVRHWATAGATLASFLGLGYWLFILYQVVAVRGPQRISAAPSPLASLFVIDQAAVFVSALVLLLGALITVYGSGYVKRDASHGPFFALLLLAATTMLGILFAGDLLTLFLFWEGMSLAAYGLVASDPREAVSLEAAIKYLLLSGAGSLTALFGIGLVYGVTGTLQLATLAPLLRFTQPSALLALLLIFAGFGVKAAIFPLHTWLPDAHASAPTPVSALLSGAVIEVAIVTIGRILGAGFAYGDVLPSLQALLTIGAILTMLTGNLGAFTQTDLKRLLAFSSIAHMGYVTLGLATFSPVGFVAVLFHIWNHGLLKANLFMLSGVTTLLTGVRALDGMGGVGRTHRGVGFLMSTSAIGMTGAPPFGIFWSELFIIQASLATDNPWLVAGVVAMLVNVLLSIAYYFRIVRTISFDAPNALADSPPAPRHSPLLIAVPAILLALSLLTGFVPQLFLGLITS